MLFLQQQLLYAKKRYIDSNRPLTYNVKLWQNAFPRHRYKGELRYATENGKKMTRARKSPQERIEEGATDGSVHIPFSAASFILLDEMP